MPCGGFRRIKGQEVPHRVIYWFESPRGDIVSFVPPTFPFTTEFEIRISLVGGGRITIPSSRPLNAGEVIREAMSAIRKVGG